MPLFKTYTSLWFLPSGMMLAILLVAPGWLKLVPLLAGLSLGIPAVQDIIGIRDPDATEDVLRAVRLYLAYGAAAWGLLKLAKVSLPFRSGRDVQAFLAASLLASFAAALTGITLQISDNRLTIEEGLGFAHLWWLGHALGAVLVPPVLVPALMLAFRRPLGEWRWPRLRYWLFQAALITTATALGISGPNLGVALWYLAIPILLVSALHGGFEKAAVSVLLAGLILPILGAVFDDPIPATELAVPLLTAAVAALLIGIATTERQRIAEHLQALVAARTGQLEHAYEMQRHLVRSLGHDLRQPIEAINLTIEGLGARVDDPVAQKSITRARDLGATASGLLTRILFYARLDAGDIEPHRHSFAASALMDELETLYGPIARRKNVTLRFDYEDTAISSDQGLLYQVLSNHLDNAIRLSTAGDAVTVTLTNEPHGIGFFVDDTIAEGAPARPGAAGMGLQITEQIASLLGAESVIGTNRRGIVLPYPERGS